MADVSTPKLGLHKIGASTDLIKLHMIDHYNADKDILDDLGSRDIKSISFNNNILTIVSTDDTAHDVDMSGAGGLKSVSISANVITFVRGDDSTLTLTIPIDSEPTSASTAFMTSGALYTKFESVASDLAALVSALTYSGGVLTVTTKDGTTTTVFTADSVVTAGSTNLVTSAAVQAAIAAAVASTFTYKGQCLTANLPTSGNHNGDIWKLLDASVYGPIGTQVVWNGTTTQWDVFSNQYTAGANVAISDDNVISSSHPPVTLETDTTSSTTVDNGGTFTVIDSVTKDSYGHTKKVNVKTVQLPELDNDIDATSENAIENRAIAARLAAMEEALYMMSVGTDPIFAESGQAIYTESGEVLYA